MPQSAPDYYKILGVPEDATQDDIKKAFRELARKWHPDMNKSPDAEKRFKEINEAYEVLKDDKKRATYDSYRKNPFGSPAGGYGGGSPFGGGTGGTWTDGNGTTWTYTSGDGIDWSDILEQMNIGMGSTRRPGGGSYGFSDILSSMFDSLYPDGSGVGGAAGNGTGRAGGSYGQGGGATYGYGQGGVPDVESELRLPIDSLLNGGRHTITMNIDGRDETFTVNVKKGIKPNSKLRFKGKGRTGADGKRGALIVKLVPDVPDGVEIDGNDVVQTVDVPFDVAVLGGKVPVRLVNGKTINLNVPSDTSSGKRLTVRGAGFDGGNDVIVVNVTVPHKTTDRLKEALRRLEGDIYAQ